jgi:DtxR family transcriptional regulator, Mn-dependent transcriptional regulator
MPSPLLSLLVAAVLAAVAFGLLQLFYFWQQSREVTDRVRHEDALKHIHNFEMDRQQPTTQSVAGNLEIGMDQAAELLEEMEQRGLLQIEQGAIRLSPNGRMTALHVIRAHRLWERYLAEETGYDAREWHGQAERYEHILSPEEVDALAAQLGNPTHDPHGDPIPTSAGEMVVHGGQPLCALPVDTVARIVHLEDEPEVVFAQLVAEGLHPGMVVHVIESNAQRVRFWTEGNEHLIAPMVAMNVSAKPLQVEMVNADEGEAERLLGALEPGQSAQVRSITSGCRGAERRRFMDLGILPGTTITAEMRSPSGDPTAYRIRGALVAIRREQADQILVSGVEA